jgi:carotenoid cleavage dioxygenase-like enzyme
VCSTFRTQRKSTPFNFFGTEIDLNNFLDLKLKNQANTNILNWGGKLLAFFEAGLPHR